MRRDLEGQVTSLLAQRDFRSSRIGPSNRETSAAAEIDNEMLRDQIQHMQEKIATLEDTMDEMRAQADREESSIRDRVIRLKEKEDSMKTELSDGRKAVEKVTKSEAAARARIEELEVALRESTHALERSRADIEAFRTDAPVRVIYFHPVLSQIIDSHLQASSHNVDEHGSEKMRVKELEQALEEQDAEIERLRKRLNRDAFVNAAALTKPNDTPQGPGDKKSTEEEISGLK
jgi:TolA-binding protein